jgi:hypothetical protein
VANPVVYLFAICLTLSCFSQEVVSEKKINGISIWSDEKPVDIKDYESLKVTNANWVSLQPYGVVWSDTGEVEFDLKNAWECSSFDGLCRNIQLAKESGYKVFLKPHIIIQYSKPFAWEGRMRRGSESSWKTLETSYSNYILSLAKIADSMDVDLFSVGTELGTFTQKRRGYWKDLIDTVRTIYSNDLTYCANFDAYRKFPFWDQMDLIGIDAYFTTSFSKTPSIKNATNGWRSKVKKLAKFSHEKDRNIIFTEFGYRSMNYAGFQPWRNKPNKRRAVNHKAQMNAYTALFGSFWGEDWFSGGFCWLWKINGDPKPTGYSPQSKPAEKILREVYLRYQ